MVKNPSWQEADQLAILQARPRSWTWGYRETTPESGQNGTWTRDLRIPSPAPWPLDHTAPTMREGKVTDKHDVMRK